MKLTIKRDLKELTLNVNETTDLVGEVKKSFKLQVPRTVIILKNQTTKKDLPEGDFRAWGAHVSSGHVITAYVKEFAIGEFLCSGEELGSGAFSQVYKAHKSDSKLVAVKVIDNNMLGSAKEKEYHERELNIIKTLSHPNIVNFYSLMEEETDKGKFTYIVMEFCGGGGLDRYLKGSLSRDHSRKFISNIAHGLKYLHSKNIIHRDLKPANVLLTSKDLDEAEAKLCDFGFSRDFSNVDLIVSHPNTPLFADNTYLIRQPLRPHEATLADLFSLGLIAHQMVTGQSLWKDVTSYEQLHQAHKNVANLLRANMQIINDSECFDFISRLLRINEPFHSFDEPLLHAYLTSRTVVIVHSTEQYNVKKTNSETAGHILTKYSNDMHIPRNMLLLLSPKGQQIVSDMSFVTYLLSLRSEDYNQLTEIPQPVIPQVTPPQRLQVSAEELPFKDLHEFLFQFEDLKGKLEGNYKAYTQAWSIFTRRIQMTQILREGRNALFNHILNLSRENAMEMEKVNTFLKDRKEKVDNIRVKLPMVLKELRETRLHPSLENKSSYGEKTHLIHFINEENVKRQFEKLHSLYEKCFQWSEQYEQLQKNVLESSFDETRIPTVQWIGDQLQSFFETAQQNYFKVKKEFDETRSTVRSGNPRISSAECYQEMLDKLKTFYKVGTESLTKLNHEIQFLKQTNLIIASIQKLLPSKLELDKFQSQMLENREHFLTFKKLIQDLQDILELPYFYQSYLSEMRRRSSFALKWNQKTSQGSEYFEKLANKEQENRIIFRTGSNASWLNLFVHDEELPSFEIICNQLSSPFRDSLNHSEEDGFVVILKDDPEELKKENDRLRSDIQNLMQKMEQLNVQTSPVLEDKLVTVSKQLTECRNTLEEYEQKFVILKKENTELEKSMKYYQDRCNAFEKHSQILLCPVCHEFSATQEAHSQHLTSQHNF